MTIDDLRSDVARLGFESSIEDEQCFVASANRALSLIYVDRPVSKTVPIFFEGPRIVMVRDFIEHRSGERITIQTEGRSISFFSNGNGFCVITDNTGSSMIPLGYDNQLTKKLLHGKATITFYGDHYFTVNALAVYGDLISDLVVDIPTYQPYNEISVSETFGDFRAFLGYPKDENGNPVKSLELIDGKIRAPLDFRGKLYLTYYRKPETINPYDPVALIDVSDECAPMLALLTASFLWLDDDAGKAQYYMSLYRDLIANVKRYSNNKLDTAYSANGWA